MKKLVALLLVLVLCIGMVACSAKNEPASDASSAAPASQPSADAAANSGSTSDDAATDTADNSDKSVVVIMQAGGLGDQGYNDCAKIGLDQMVEKYGLNGTLVEAPSAAEADTFVRQLAEDGYQLVICLDWTIIDYVREASKDYPDVMFLVLGKGAPGPGTQENLVEPYTALHEWAFEAAMASILIAQDGNELFEENARPGCKIAMIRAGESVNATRSRAAYQQCIEELNPDAEAVFDYTGSYTDSALNQQIVENMIKNQGVELVWPCVGTGALAAFTTAKLNHAYALGCDSNQDAVEPGTIPTSVLHNTTYMVINTIEEWMNGTLKGTNEYYWGLASGVVGLTDFATIAGVEGVNLDNLERIKSTINEWNEKIINGDFIVYDSFQNDNMEYNEWKELHPDTNYTEWVKAGRPA